MSDIVTLYVLDKFKKKLADLESTVREAGPEGPKGSKGDKGDKGDKGAQGPKGADGAQGPKGADGSEGPEGPKGDTGTSVTDAYLAADGDIVFVLDNGTEVSVEIPLLTTEDGQMILYSQTGGGGGGGGGGTDADLDKYVLRPTDKQEGKWQVYRELDDGTREWTPVTTELVETNPAITFNIGGRFNPSQDELDNLTTQLKVNRFLWEHIQQLDLDKSGIEVGPNPPTPVPGEELADGTFWFDNTEEVMQLFLWHEASNAWIPVAPPTTLEARVRQGEITQEAIIAQIQDSLAEQARIKDSLDATASDLSDKISKQGENILSPDSAWIIRQRNLAGNNRTFMNIHDGEMSLYNVAYPGNPSHAANQQYVDDVAGASLPRTAGDHSVHQAYRIKSTVNDGSNWTFIKIDNDEMGLYHLQEPGEPHHAATRSYVDDKVDSIEIPETNLDGYATQEYVDNQVGSIEPGMQQYNLWKFVGETVDAEQLKDGEFTIRTETGGNPKLKIYMARKDAAGRFWYAGSSSGEWSHDLGAQMVTISDSDGEVRKGGKMTSANFNVSTNKYCRLYCEYYKSNYGLNTNRYYSINVPGLLPLFHYSPDYQNNGMSRSAFAVEDKTEEDESVQIGCPMEGEE